MLQIKSGRTCQARNVGEIVRQQLVAEYGPDDNTVNTGTEVGELKDALTSAVRRLFIWTFSRQLLISS